MKLPPHACHANWESPLGTLTLAATDAGLCGAWFAGQKHWPDLARARALASVSEHPLLARAAAQLAEYFAGQRRVFDLPLDLSGGTAFEQSVWRALGGIGAGGTASYGGIAASLGRPSAARAVGAAVGRNPLSIIVPCHRVLGAGGALTGYAGGLPRKVALLRADGVAVA